jgi:hypothetical protein
VATETEIRIVKELLGADAADSGWDDNRIGEDLDSGMTANQVALAWWSYRSAKTVNLTSVSESGSSRQLREIHQNAVAMRDYFKKLVDADAAEAEEPETDATRGPGIRTFPIRRIAR